MTDYKKKYMYLLEDQKKDIEEEILAIGTTRDQMYQLNGQLGELENSIRKAQQDKEPLTVADYYPPGFTEEHQSE